MDGETVVHSELRRCLKAARYARNGEELPGVVLFLHGSPAEIERQVLPLPDEDAIVALFGPEALKFDQRDVWAHMIATMMRSSGAWGYIMVVEAWVSSPREQMRPDAALALIQQYPPSQAPEDLFIRREVVMASYEGLGGAEMALMEIKPGGGFGDIEFPTSMGDDVVNSGRFHGLAKVDESCDA